MNAEKERSVYDLNTDRCTLDHLHVQVYIKKKEKKYQSLGRYTLIAMITKYDLKTVKTYLQQVHAL